MPILDSVFSQVFRSVIGDVNWLPTSLFTQGEQGIWYDPSDISTLFQDNLGITPVTATGQTVGLMLDKSKSLAVGADVWPGGFSTSGWTTSLTVLTNDGSGYLVATFAATNSYMFKSFSCLQNTAYVLNLAISGAGLNYTISTSGVSGNIAFAANVSGPTVRIQFNSGANTSISIGLSKFSGAGVSTISAIEVKSLAGNHATQATSTQRPLYQIDGTGRPYLSFDGVDDNMVIPSLSLTGAEPLFFCFGVKRLATTSKTNLLGFGLSGNSTTNTGFAFLTRGSTAPVYTLGLATSSGVAATSLLGVANAFGDAVTRVASATKTQLRVNSSAISTTGNTVNFGVPVTQNNRLGCAFITANVDFWKGNIYSVIFLAGAVTDGQIASAENWVNSKTGAF